MRRIFLFIRCLVRFLVVFFISNPDCLYIMEQQLDEGKVRELVGNIVSHPLFQETLNNLFNNSSSTPNALQTQRSSSSVSITPTQSASTAGITSRSFSTTRPNATGSTGGYTTPAQEFSALFRRGSSSRGTTPTYRRGISHQQVARTHRRASSAPYASSQRSNGPRAREQIFRTKDVVLLPDSKTERVLRAPEKANLMEQGFVLSELMISKTWSDREVIEYFEDCFREKLADAAPISPDVGGTVVSSRYSNMMYAFNLSLI